METPGSAGKSMDALNTMALPTHLVEYKARTRIQHYLKPPKNPRYLETAVWWMEHMRQEDLPQIKALEIKDLPYLIR
jgi:hypothetical protein